ncbi:MAG: MFS transporter [Acidobacteriota bacterium]|nr:MFS transporter [Acidobacteriota bacterium]
MKRFLALVFGQTVSQLGSGLTSFALGVWIFESSGSATRFALVAFFSMVPQLVMMPLAGNLADRWSRKGTMILGDSLAGLLTLVLLLVFYFDLQAYWIIYLVVAISAASSSIQQLGFQASVALFVPREQLGRANGAVQLGRSMSLLLAPLAAGYLLGILGVDGILFLDLITMILAVLTVVFVPFPALREAAAPEELGEEAAATAADAEAADGVAGAPGPAGAAAQSPPKLGAFAEGWAYLRQRPGLLGLLATFAGVNFCLGSVEALLTPLVLSLADEKALGSVLFFAGLGMLTGGLTLSVWGGPRRRVRGILILVALEGLVLVLCGVQAEIIFVSVAAFCFMVLTPMVAGTSQALWQSKVEVEKQGRVFAVRQMLAMAAMPLAFLTAGPLADYVFEPAMEPGGWLAASVGGLIGTGPGRGIGFYFVLLGGLLAVLAVISYANPMIRRLEEDLPDQV